MLFTTVKLMRPLTFAHVKEGVCTKETLRQESGMKRSVFLSLFQSTILTFSVNPVVYISCANNLTNFQLDILCKEILYPLASVSTLPPNTSDSLIYLLSLWMCPGHFWIILCVTFHILFLSLNMIFCVHSYLSMSINMSMGKNTHSFSWLSKPFLSSQG